MESGVRTAVRTMSQREIESMPSLSAGPKVGDKPPLQHMKLTPDTGVVPAGDASVKAGRLEPEALNDTNRMELRVFMNEEARHVVLVARLDNLGKGASGAAVQNLKLMLSL